MKMQQMNNLSLLPLDTVLTFIIVAIVAIIILAVIVHSYIKNPFSFPTAIIRIDATGRKSPDIYNELDRYLNEHGMSKIDFEEDFIAQWKTDCEKRISHSVWKTHRRKQFESVIPSKEILVLLQKKQTRYRQKNYKRYAYKKTITLNKESFSYQDIESRYEQLCEIGNTCTLKEYFSHNQRKLMTPALRKKIMERDNYTCQMCGKYMPDEVGLQIDHIIPVAKGGKTVPDNLQVLCSKCNGKKKAKIIKM